MARPLVIAETRRCVLRSIVPGDRPDLERIYTDAKVRRYLGGALTPAEIESACNALLNSSDSTAIVVRRAADAAFLGLITAAPHPDEAEPELSYQFVPEHWGRGLAREALAATIEHFFTVHKVSGLVAETRYTNMPSRRLLERLGFTAKRSLDRFEARQVIYRKANASLPD